MLNDKSRGRKEQWHIVRFYPNIYLKLQRETTKDSSCLSYGKTSKPGISPITRTYNPNEWKETFSNQFVI